MIATVLYLLAGTILALLYRFKLQRTRVMLIEILLIVVFTPAILLGTVIYGVGWVMCNTVSRILEYRV